MNKKLIPKRDEFLKNHKWDISLLFNSDEEWEALFVELEANIENIYDYKNRLSKSIEIFKKAIDLDLDISRKLERLSTYAHLRSDEDKTNQKYLALYQRAINLNSRITEVTSFLAPEIQSIQDETMTKYLEDERLDEYRFFLEKVLRYRPHTLKEEIEKVLSMASEMSYAPSQFFSQLDNGDLKFGTIEDDENNIVELSHGNFNSFLMSQNRELRKKAFSQYYSAYKDHEQCIATALYYSMKKDYFYSRVRRFGSCRSAALFSDNIPEEVYDNLIDTVRNNLNPLFKYFGFRRDALGLTDLHFYDTYVPIVSDINFSMTYEEAVKVCTDALRPLGDEYITDLEDGLLGGWVDRYENQGKRSGAYSSGCYDSPPYILMNYKDDNINSLYTLIHEAGHSMHTLYSNRNQPYLYHNYTIFVAEVASTFNEALLSSYLLDYYNNDAKMKAYILTREIDNIRATLFRQTMFAEFEKTTHSIIEDNKALTLDVITEVYRELLQIYFGDEIIIDDILTLECLRIPHFYSPFYVYKYATGISAALALADRVLNGDELARTQYIKFLKMGGRQFPLDELLLAGIDMRKPQPIENAIQYFENSVDRLKQIYKILH